MLTKNNPVQLTEEQEAAVEALANSNKPVTTMGGFAGTGKTSVIWHLLRRLPNFAVCAFTGKAANVLRRKGIPASTIHSLIYVPEGDETWALLPPNLLACDGFVVDEASMVSKEIHDDLTSYGLPVIYVGDHGQLEPVSADRGFNLMADPNVTLETIHRNAGEIAHFAQWLRCGGAVSDWPKQPECTGEKVRVMTTDDLVGWQGSDADQIICAFNRTRVGLNKMAREHLGLPGGGPVVGDRVMCLQNNRDLGVFNGMQGTVEGVRGDQMRFKSDDQVYRVQFVPEQFNCEGKAKEYNRERIPFDYCYAVTCHKAQGDEWPHVMVLEQFCGAWDHRRWTYTAASRARERLTWVTGVGAI